MQHNEGFLKLVNEAKARIKQTNADEVARRLQAGDKLAIIDVREDTEWQQGHVKDAIHLGKGVIERDVESRFPDKNQELILYCGGGFRSALAADALRQMGYKGAISMDGGWKAWQEKHLPIEA